MWQSQARWMPVFERVENLILPSCLSFCLDQHALIYVIFLSQILQFRYCAFQFDDILFHCDKVSRMNKKRSCCCDSRSYTAYDVRYAGKLSNRFPLQVDKRYAQSDSTGRLYESIQTLSTQKFEVHQVSEQQNVTRPEHA